MSKVIDQTVDLNGQSIHRILSLYGAPAFVKEADHTALCGDEHTEPHLFGDVTRKNYPCHTAAATWMSAAFFMEKKAELPKDKAERLEKRIAESAEYFGIGQEINDLQQKIATAGITDLGQLPDSTFAIVFEANGKKERHYPLRNAKETQKAASFLLESRDELPFADRNNIASRVLTAANQFGADVTKQRYDLEKMAGLGACSAKDAAALIQSRVDALGRRKGSAAIREELTKTASIIIKNKTSFHHFGTMQKLAEVIDTFDREHGLTKYYGDSLDRPEDVLFSVTEKIASEMANDIVGNEMTGNFYKVADLQRLPLSELGDALGNELVDAVSTAGAWVDTEKLAKILPTLPRHDAELFDAVAANNGIPPFAVKSGAALEIPAFEQEAMAAAHKPETGSLWSRI